MKFNLSTNKIKGAVFNHTIMCHMCKRVFRFEYLLSCYCQKHQFFTNLLQTWHRPTHENCLTIIWKETDQLLLHYIDFVQGRIEPSSTWGRGWFGGTWAPIARLQYEGGGDRAIWWILLGVNSEQAMCKGEKNSSLGLTDPNFTFWEKFSKKNC